MSLEELIWFILIPVDICITLFMYGLFRYWCWQTRGDHDVAGANLWLLFKLTPVFLFSNRFSDDPIPLLASYKFVLEGRSIDGACDAKGSDFWFGWLMQFIIYLAVTWVVYWIFQIEDVLSYWWVPVALLTAAFLPRYLWDIKRSLAYKAKTGNLKRIDELEKTISELMGEKSTQPESKEPASMVPDDELWDSDAHKVQPVSDLAELCKPPMLEEEDVYLSERECIDLLGFVRRTDVDVSPCTDAESRKRLIRERYLVEVLDLETSAEHFNALINHYNGRVKHVLSPSELNLLNSVKRHMPKGCKIEPIEMSNYTPMISESFSFKYVSLDLSTDIGRSCLYALNDYLTAIDYGSFDGRANVQSFVDRSKHGKLVLSTIGSDALEHLFKQMKTIIIDRQNKIASRFTNVPPGKE